MYYLQDLYENIAYSFPDRRAIARFWFKKFGLAFDELNVTGNDTRVGFTEKLVRDKDGDYKNVSVRCQWLRRYHVLDDAGRSVDIRKWPEDVFHEAAREYDHRAYNHGSKRSNAHRRGPTLQLGAMRANADDTYMDECNLDAVRDGSRLRRKAVMNTSEFADHCGARWKKSDSWKDQTRAPRQYARHKRGAHVPARSVVPNEGLDENVAATDLNLDLEAAYFYENFATT